MIVEPSCAPDNLSESAAHPRTIFILIYFFSGSNMHNLCPRQKTVAETCRELPHTGWLFVVVKKSGASRQKNRPVCSSPRQILKFTNSNWLAVQSSNFLAYFILINWTPSNIILHFPWRFELSTIGCNFIISQNHLPISHCLLLFNVWIRKFVLVVSVK